MINSVMKKPRKPIPAPILSHKFMLKNFCSIKDAKNDVLKTPMKHKCKQVKIKFFSTKAKDLSQGKTDMLWIDILSNKQIRNVPQNNSRIYLFDE